MTFERTFDYELVRQIMTHPAIYAGIRDDTAPPVAQFQPEVSNRIWYVLVKDDADVLGLFVCFLHNAVCWEAHTCLLPHCRGAKALAVYKAGHDWLREHTTCRKIIGAIDPQNKAALWMSLSSGLKRIGLNTKSILKHGRLCDQIWVGKEL